MDCPFECAYLQESRVREKRPILNPDEFPNQDIRVSDRFLEEREPLLLFVAGTLAAAGLQVRAIDNDIREALDALIRTFRTLQSGLYYESVPPNPIAAHVFQEIRRNVDAFRERLAQQQGVHSVRDTDVLGILIFLQRLELQHNNGRRKGRAFLQFLLQYFPAEPGEQVAQGAQRIIT
ncbi:MAG TPA: hypothetical protein VFL57_18725 [Bryobacteraceae bacterium]|nr:hypothetical protein [Bryobacteraceae bacterium]